MSTLLDNPFYYGILFASILVVKVIEIDDLLLLP